MSYAYGGKKTRQEKEYIGMVKSYYEGTQRSRQERPGEVAENSSGTAGIERPQAFARISVEVEDALKKIYLCACQRFYSGIRAKGSKPGKNQSRAKESVVVEYFVGTHNAIKKEGKGNVGRRTLWDCWNAGTKKKRKRFLRLKSIAWGRKEEACEKKTYVGCY
ncbi:hypothetical protein Tco_0617568 [Tanacetum coccineum]